jgi:hypothetical protein
MFDKIKKISWKIICSVSYTIKNELENNFLCFIFFWSLLKKNRDKIWKMKILKVDQIEKKNLILYIILNKINNKKNKNQIW